VDQGAENGAEEGRRAFFKSVGRAMVLGLTGAGITYLARNGQIDICINEHVPCTRCTLLTNGCELPKAVDYRRQQAHG
jgi:hypothetical protein